MNRFPFSKYILFFCLRIFLFPFLIPQKMKMPVYKADKNSYNQKSFWFYPWGRSGVHKGVDIFAKEGTTIFSSTIGLVLFTGSIEMGGNVVVILGPKWRIHYYAHLKNIYTKPFRFVNSSIKIGTVGNSGNAMGKPPHLHYTILTLIPYIWLIDSGIYGLEKMFFLNPILYLNEYLGVQ